MLLYIHIPFCDSKCYYCNFNSYSNQNNLKDDYINALILQLKRDLKEFRVNSIESVFFGGGTPSVIQAQKYKKIFNIIEKYLQDGCEITIEANPNSATKEWLQEIRKIGINRVSFGVQSFDDNKLKYLGRKHDKRCAIASVDSAFDVGFKNISIDLIY